MKHFILVSASLQNVYHNLLTKLGNDESARWILRCYNILEIFYL